MRVKLIIASVSNHLLLESFHHFPLPLDDHSHPLSKASIPFLFLLSYSSNLFSSGTSSSQRGPADSLPVGQAGFRLPSVSNLFHEALACDHQFDRLPFLQWLYNILTLRFELQKHGQNLNVHAMSSNSRRQMIHLIKIEAKRFTRQSSPLRRLTAVAMDMVAFDWVKRWTTNDWTRKCEYHWVRVAILSIERTWKWWKGARVLEGCLPP